MGYIKMGYFLSSTTLLKYESDHIQHNANDKTSSGHIYKTNWQFNPNTSHYIFANLGCVA
jgi:hypothetical protein